MRKRAELGFAGFAPGIGQRTRARGLESRLRRGQLQRRTAERVVRRVMEVQESGQDWFWRDTVEEEQDGEDMQFWADADRWYLRQALNESAEAFEFACQEEEGERKGMGIGTSRVDMAESRPPTDDIYVSKDITPTDDIYVAKDTTPTDDIYVAKDTTPTDDIYVAKDIRVELIFDAISGELTIDVRHDVETQNGSNFGSSLIMATQEVDWEHDDKMLRGLSSSTRRPFAKDIVEADKIQSEIDRLEERKRMLQSKLKQCAPQAAEES